jgi:hypothetical protein
VIKPPVGVTEAEIGEAVQVTSTSQEQATAAKAGADTVGADTETTLDDLVMAQILEVCAAHVVADLATRIKIGGLINQRLGLPCKRQQRGKGFMERAAKETGYSVSELSRMRWLNHRFPTVKTLEESYPGVKTWTQVKKLLSELNQGDGNGRPTDPAVQRRRALAGINKSLEATVKKLGNFGKDNHGPALDEKELVKLGTIFGQIRHWVDLLCQSGEPTPTLEDSVSGPVDSAPAVPDETESDSAPEATPVPDESEDSAPEPEPTPPAPKRLRRVATPGALRGQTL